MLFGATLNKGCCNVDWYKFIGGLEEPVPSIFREADYSKMVRI
jgi:hypothetical protein